MIEIVAVLLQLEDSAAPAASILEPTTAISDSQH
jgi:hypothetical protein